MKQRKNSSEINQSYYVQNNYNENVYIIYMYVCYLALRNFATAPYNPYDLYMCVIMKPPKTDQMCVCW